MVKCVFFTAIVLALFLAHKSILFKGMGATEHASFMYEGYALFILI